MCQNRRNTHSDLFGARRCGLEAASTDPLGGPVALLYEIVKALLALAYKIILRIQ